MSEITEEPLDAAAPVSGEEPADTPSPRKPRGKIPDLSEIVEGKRAKKTVERLEFQISKPKEKLKVEDGGGDKLGEIPRTNHMIGKLKPGDLKPLHAIMFDRPGKTVSMRKNMRQFNGFLFDVNSEQFTKKRERLLRTSSLTNTKLRVICKVLDLEKKGTQSDLVDRILTFLSAPKNSGKPLLLKKKKRSKKKLSGGDSKAKSKPRPKSTSASPKKTKSGSKSKAIVMDSSSDDDEEEDEDEKTGTRAEEEEAKESGNEQEKSDDSEDSGEEEEEEEGEGEDEDEEAEEEDEQEDESPKSKAPARKPAAGKRPRAPTKKSPAPRKRAKKALSESDSEADEKPKKKAAAKGAKPAAKTKKADSSSNSKKNSSKGSELCPGSEDSSDDDRPLIKMVRQALSDEQLKETIKSLLADADLAEITMKQICQRVYDAYPDHDLASRKDYIKQTVKALIT